MWFSFYSFHINLFEIIVLGFLEFHSTFLLHMNWLLFNLSFTILGFFCLLFRYISPYSSNQYSAILVSLMCDQQHFRPWWLHFDLFCKTGNRCGSSLNAGLQHCGCSLELHFMQFIYGYTRRMSVLLKPHFNAQLYCTVSSIDRSSKMQFCCCTICHLRSAAIVTPRTICLNRSSGV